MFFFLIFQTRDQRKYTFPYLKVGNHAQNPLKNNNREMEVDATL